MTHITKLTEVVDGRLLPSDKKLSASLLEVDAGRLTVSENTLGFDATGLATETFVSNAIASAQLGGGEVDLSGYATKADLEDYSRFDDVSTALFGMETVLNEKVAGLATKDELAEYPKTVDVLASLGEQAEGLESQIALKADVSVLSGYATKDDLASKTSAEDVQALIDNYNTTVINPGLTVITQTLGELVGLQDDVETKLEIPTSVDPSTVTTPTVNSLPLYTLGNNGEYVLCTPDTWLNINGFLVPGYNPATIQGSI